jgi:hypothetical protein
MAAHWNAHYTTAQASYDLRRLRLKGLIERVAGTNTYRITPHGRRTATFLTRLAARVVIPALTELDALARPPRTTPRPLRDSWRAYERTLDTLVRQRLAA